MNSAAKLTKIGGSKEWGKKARKLDGRNTRSKVKNLVLRDQKENS